MPPKSVIHTVFDPFTLADEELDIPDDQLVPPVHLDENFDNILLVDRVPIVPEAKYDKLKQVLSKIFTQVGKNTLHLPQDGTKTTQGFCFVEYESAQAAETALKAINGYKLDKNHTFIINTYADFMRLQTVSDTYQEPPQSDLNKRENLKSWLLDRRAVDQFVITFGDETEVFWNTVKKLGHRPESALKSRHKWSDTYVQWSPYGTYLATFHHAGVTLWGGESFSRIVRFAHQGVKLLDFSPCEKYMITFSPQFQENDDAKDPKCLIVWDVRSGAKLRGFTWQKEGKDQVKPVWPVFRWSHDDKYIARLGENQISVFETPSMGLLDKKSLKILGVTDFAWSPSDNYMAVFVPEQTNTPARVSLLELPSRMELRQRNLFQVTDCKLHWQSAGDFLCVKVDRHTKSKKSTYHNFELFRIREKDIPIDLLELKDSVVAFAWEPAGNRFAVVHNPKDQVKPDVSFYQIGKEVTLLHTAKQRACNALFWSPAGSYIVLAGLEKLGGQLEFFNVNDNDTMSTEEHTYCSSIDWDPTGRFVVTSVSFWRHQVDTGFMLWSFQGKQLFKTLKERFTQFLWRPRPPTLLSTEQLSEIKKNLNSKYLPIYEKEDNEEIEHADRARREAQKKMEDDFNSLLEKRRQQFAGKIEERKKQLAFLNSPDNFLETFVWVEEVVSVHEEPVDS